MRWLMRLARSRWMGRVIGWMFAHMSFAIPVRRLRETPTLLAFHHPQPVYALHILIVPKAARGGLADLSAADAAFLVDLFDVVRSLAAEFALDETGYRLVANGGAYQDIPHLHFHLIADMLARDTTMSPVAGS